MDFDWSLLGTVVGGGATALLTRFLGITQRMQSLERRLDTQGELVANLHTENSALRGKVAEQDRVIVAQGHLIGDLTRQNKEQAAQIETLNGEVARKDADNAALASQMNALRMEIWGGNTKPSGLPADLYGAERPVDVRLPKPPRLPTL